MSNMDFESAPAPEGLAGAAGAVASGHFNPADYEPKSAPDNPLSKMALSVFGVIVLLYPYLFHWFHPVGIEVSQLQTFAIVAVVVLTINLLILFYVRSFILQKRHEEWKEALGKISSLKRNIACEGVRDTLFAFRHLLKWRRFLKLSRPPFTFGYLLVIGYTIALALESAFPSINIGGRIPGFDFLSIKHLAVYALAYYAVVLLLRRVIREFLLEYTEKLDPTVKICEALSELHVRLQSALGNRNPI